jgi:hypothetical protein
MSAFNDIARDPWPTALRYERLALERDGLPSSLILPAQALTELLEAGASDAAEQSKRENEATEILDAMQAVRILNRCRQGIHGLLRGQ